MKDNQMSKVSFQVAYFPDFLHKETAEIFQVAQRFMEVGERSRYKGKQVMWK